MESLIPINVLNGRQARPWPVMHARLPPKVNPWIQGSPTLNSTPSRLRLLEPTAYNPAGTALPPSKRATFEKAGMFVEECKVPF